MKENPRFVALVLFSFTSLVIVAGLELANASLRNAIGISRRAPGSIQGPSRLIAMPNYYGYNSNDVCSGQNLANSLQRPSYGCDGYPGSTCVSCVPGMNAPISISGLGTGAGQGSFQPNGGTNGNCSNYLVYYGQCINPGGNYSCNPMIEVGSSCVGTYPYYDTQIQPGPVALDGPSRAKPGHLSDERRRLIVIR